MLKKISLFCSLFFLGVLTHAQILGSASQDSNLGSLVTTENLSAFSQAQFAGVDTGASNGIFIRQIGEENIAQITTSSANDGLARIDLLQNGDNNYANIIDSSREFFKNIVQDGDGNRILDYSLPSNLSTNFQLLQQGDNLTLEKFGTNSLTEEMKVNMTGNARTLIIRSF